MIRLQAQWWKAVGWVPILGEHQPSLQTLHCTPYQHGHGSAHLHTSPAPVAQSTPPHQVFSAPTRWPSEVLDQTPSPGLRKPCRVSCWQLDTSLAAAWQQRLRLQGFPWCRILRLRLSKTCLGRTKEKRVRPPGLAKLCKCENNQPKIIILTCSLVILIQFFYRRSFTFA